MKRSPTEIMRDVHAELSGHLDSILAMFERGAKVTLIIRNPDLDDADIVIGNDDLEVAVAKALEMDRRRNEPDGGVRTLDTRTTTRLQ